MSAARTLSAMNSANYSDLYYGPPPLVHKAKKSGKLGYEFVTIKGKGSYRQIIPWQCNKPTDINAYKPYRVLYSERKFCRKPTVVISSHVTFLDLPAELRNRIYEYLSPGQGNYYLVTGKASPYRISPVGQFEGKTKYREIVHGLRLGRANKQLNVECASFFYSENLFVFTGPDRDAKPLRLLNKIGSNVRYLNKIAFTTFTELGETLDIIYTLTVLGFAVPERLPEGQTDVVQIANRDLSEAWEDYMVEKECLGLGPFYIPDTYEKAKELVAGLRDQLKFIAVSKATSRVLLTKGDVSLKFVRKE
ncbi:hypothetical protein FKW77_004726 [Venturia effusa]|uniref:Uncharacterized protein n=1 Tax=Venturia effusa TaxID=50376 RepID=A0A517LQ35_9PEZI|nr:hypothetical protein FKW77_004726 [Venturia effusa]